VKADEFRNLFSVLGDFLLRLENQRSLYWIVIPPVKEMISREKLFFMRRTTDGSSTRKKIGNLPFSYAEFEGRR
jgi:hypothetical protein